MKKNFLLTTLSIRFVVVMYAINQESSAEHSASSMQPIQSPVGGGGDKN